jgi:hypothetical protein
MSLTQEQPKDGDDKLPSEAIELLRMMEEEEASPRLLAHRLARLVVDQHAAIDQLTTALKSASERASSSGWSCDRARVALVKGAAVKDAPIALERVLDHCTRLTAANKHAYVDPDALWVARFIVETLGARFPGGFVQPRVVGVPDGAVVMFDDIEFGSRAEALGVAAAIIRCALELPEEEEA